MKPCGRQAAAIKKRAGEGRRKGQGGSVRCESTERARVCGVIKPPERSISGDSGLGG